MEAKADFKAQCSVQAFYADAAENKIKMKNSSCLRRLLLARFLYRTGPSHRYSNSCTLADVITIHSSLLESHSAAASSLC